MSTVEASWSASCTYLAKQCSLFFSRHALATQSHQHLVRQMVDFWHVWMDMVVWYFGKILGVEHAWQVVVPKGIVGGSIGRG